MGDVLSKRHGVGALGAVVITLAGGLNAAAQPASNSLVPGIAPYAPKAPPPKASPKPGRAASKSGKSDVAGASSGPEMVSYDYRLGSGDKLRITVFGEDGLSGEFFVAGNGTISFPLIGEVAASGKTVQDVQAEITAALKDGYLKDPRVSAEVLIFRPYYILGEVTKPGEYPYTDGITVMNAVATAGGFTYRANQKYIFLKKANEDVEHKVRLTDDLKIQPGETVRVIERYF